MKDQKAKSDKTETTAVVKGSETIEKGNSEIETKKSEVLKEPTKTKEVKVDPVVTKPEGNKEISTSKIKKVFDRFINSKIGKLSPEASDAAFAFIEGIRIALEKEPGEEVVNEMKAIFAEHANGKLSHLVLGTADLNWVHSEDSRNAYAGLVTYFITKNNNVKTLASSQGHLAFKDRYAIIAQRLYS